MGCDTIFTIGRQFGSGGREIGKMLADKLGLRFYDVEILNEAARESGLCRQIFDTHDEKPAQSFFFTSWSAPFHFSEMPLGQQICMAQFKAIRKIAKDGGCVIVGRCADYVLKNDPRVISVFLWAAIEFRARRIKEESGITNMKKLTETIRQADKNRASYYNFFTDRKWGNGENYDMCINTGKRPFRDIVDAISAYAAARRG